MPDAPRCVVLGAGGHASAVIDALLEQGRSQPVAALDPDEEKWGDDIHGVPVVGGDDRLTSFSQKGVERFVVAVGSVGDASTRRQLVQDAEAEGLEPLTVAHPASIISHRSDIRAGTQLLANSVVNPDAELGAHVIVNTGAVVEHGCKLGDFVHVAPNATLCSEVHVGDGAHVGAGATVGETVDVGEDSLVAAGATVVEDVPPGSQVQGVPAREIT